MDAQHDDGGQAVESLGHTLLAGIVGSRAYGLDHAGSDTDRMSVHQLPTESLLGLQSPALTRTRQGPEGDDTSSHEVGKFLSLVLACNPTVSELLWLPTGLYETLTPDGHALLGMRGSFLSARGVRNSYLGYANAQAQRCKREFVSESRAQKAARHAYRLVEQGTGLWLTGSLTVKVADRERCIDFGQRVAAGRTELLGEMLSSAEAVFEKPTELQGDVAAGREAADAWLKRLRLRQATTGWDR